MGSRNTTSKSAHSTKPSPRGSKPSAAGKKSSSPAKASGRSASDSSMGNDILGVIIAVLAVALFISVISPSDAILARFAWDILFYGFGIGAYILPILLFIWSTTFFVKRKDGLTWRIGLGLLLILIAILSILAINTPDATQNRDVVFASAALVSRGGYVGAGIAWLLLALVDRIIGIVILVGVAICGCVVIGLSISGIVQRSQERLQAARDMRSDDADKTLVKDTPRRRSAKARAQEDPADAKTTAMPVQSEDEDASATRVLPSRRSKKHSDDTVVLDDAQSAKTVSLADKTAQLPQTAAPTAMDGFSLPPTGLLKTTSASVAKQQAKVNSANLKEVAAHLQSTLESFNLYANVVGWVSGPTFTMFKVEMPTGVKLNKITGLQDDIALALAAESVRIFAPIPGTSLVGVEVPNAKRATVLLGDVLATMTGGPLVLALGRDVEGDMISADLASMPHLLIGGATGSGKSVAINSMLMSMLMRATPAEVRMILIDPKRVELSLYNGIPHLYVPVVTDPKQAAATLAWATIEMDRRLKVFEKAGTRNIGLYNAMVQDGRLGDECEEMPYIVIVIDELADLMMVAGKEVEGSIIRIAQLARAAGIHLIVATQRPSSNVVTGMIKANITNRISFKVATSVDSRVILDQSGAEKLIGLGDLLFLRGDAGEPKRIQGCYVSEAETVAVVEHLKSQGEPDYHEEILSTNIASGGQTSSEMDGGSENDDPLLWEAAEIVVSTQLGSTSNIQRRLRVGYARAGRIMDQLESKGIVGPPDGSRPREVMIGDVVELESFKALDAYEGSEET